MIRPSPTPTASFKKYGTVDHPVMGEVRVGVGEGDNERFEAMAMDRASWNGSVVTSTTLTPWRSSTSAAAAMFSYVLSPPACMMSHEGTPLLSRYIAPDSASVQ